MKEIYFYIFRRWYAWQKWFCYTDRSWLNFRKMADVKFCFKILGWWNFVVYQYWLSWRPVPHFVVYQYWLSWRPVPHFVVYQYWLSWRPVPHFVVYQYWLSWRPVPHFVVYQYWLCWRPVQQFHPCSTGTVVSNTAVKILPQSPHSIISPALFKNYTILRNIIHHLRLYFDSSLNVQSLDRMYTFLYV